MHEKNERLKAKSTLQRDRAARLRIEIKDRSRGLSIKLADLADATEDGYPEGDPERFGLMIQADAAKIASLLVRLHEIEDRRDELSELSK